MDPYDLRSLFALREQICSLPAEPAFAIVAPTPPRARRIALLPGSFNPPTSAHLLLAERALGDGFDSVVFVLARSTAGKQHTGLMLEDRILALRSIVPAGGAIAVTSASLYCDQAEAAASTFSGADLSILTGSDKLEEIFDASWYGVRDESLQRLFGFARLVVAPRGNGADGVRALLARPENRAFAPHVDFLPLHPAVGDLSSTRVRGLLASGSDPAGLMPAVVASLISALGAFSPADPDSGIDRYAIRVALVDALWKAREWAAESADLRALTDLALSPTEEGDRLRTLIRRGGTGDHAPGGGISAFAHLRSDR